MKTAEEIKAMSQQEFDSIVSELSSKMTRAHMNHDMGLYYSLKNQISMMYAHRNGDYTEVAGLKGCNRNRFY